MATPTVTRDKTILRMSRAAAPVARMAPGTSIHLETADCFSDQVQGPGDVGRGIDWNTGNPATGPVYVEGAEPGDVLAVGIESILVSDHGVMCTGGGFGVLGDRIGELQLALSVDSRGEARSGRAVPAFPSSR